MTKAIITISNYVDVSVQETQKDTKFNIQTNERNDSQTI